MFIGGLKIVGIYFLEHCVYISHPTLKKNVIYIN